MNEEQIMILKMLEEGKITVDEAERLLNALRWSETGPEQSADDSMKGLGGGGVFPGDFMQSLTSSLEEMGRKLEQAFHRDFSGFFGGEVQEFSASEETLRFDVGEEAHLDMAHRHGTVQISAWDEPAVSIRFTKKVRAEDSETASSILDAIRVAAQADGKTVSVSTIYPEDRRLWQGRRQAQVDYQISVPHHTELVLKQEHGDVSIDGLLGPIDLDCRHGRITLDNADAPVHLQSEHGDIVLQHLHEHLELHKRHGSVILRDIASANISHEHGNLSVEEAQGDLKVERAHGHTRIERIQGNFEVLHRHGGVKIEATPRAEGNCRVDASHANVDLCLTDLPASHLLYASTHHGRIETQLTGQLTTEHQNQELRVGEPEAPLKIELTAHYGNIRIDIKEVSDE